MGLRLNNKTIYDNIIFNEKNDDNLLLAILENFSLSTTEQKIINCQKLFRLFLLKEEAKEYKNIQIFLKNKSKDIFSFIAQPRGKQQSPDFIINIIGNLFPIEAKGSNKSTIVMNGHFIEYENYYIFITKIKNTILYFRGKDCYENINQYQQLKDKIEEQKEEDKKIKEKQNNEINQIITSNIFCKRYARNTYEPVNIFKLKELLEKNRKIV